MYLEKNFFLKKMTTVVFVPGPPPMVQTLDPSVQTFPVSTLDSTTGRCEDIIYTTEGRDVTERGGNGPLVVESSTGVYSR